MTVHPSVLVCGFLAGPGTRERTTVVLSPLCGSVPTMGDGQAGLDAPPGYTALTWPSLPGWQGEGLPAARVCLWFPLEKWGFWGDDRRQSRGDGHCALHLSDSLTWNRGEVAPARCGRLRGMATPVSTGMAILGGFTSVCRAQMGSRQPHNPNLPSWAAGHFLQPVFGLSPQRCR